VRAMQRPELGFARAVTVFSFERVSRNGRRPLFPDSVAKHLLRRSMTRDSVD
jgi:hypothetical protein